MYKVGDRLNNDLRVIKTEWVKTEKSHYKVIYLQCNRCGRIFAKTENTITAGNMRCLCHNGYEPHEYGEKKIN